MIMPKGVSTYVMQITEQQYFQQAIFPSLGINVTEQAGIRLTIH